MVWQLPQAPLHHKLFVKLFVPDERAVQSQWSRTTLLQMSSISNLLIFFLSNGPFESFVFVRVLFMMKATLTFCLFPKYNLFDWFGLCWIPRVPLFLRILLLVVQYVTESAVLHVCLFVTFKWKLNWKSNGSIHRSEPGTTKNYCMTLLYCPISDAGVLKISTVHSWVSGGVYQGHILYVRSVSSRAKIKWLLSLDVIFEQLTDFQL